MTFGFGSGSVLGDGLANGEGFGDAGEGVGGDDATAFAVNPFGVALGDEEPANPFGTLGAVATTETGLVTAAGTPL